MSADEQASNMKIVSKEAMDTLYRRQQAGDHDAARLVAVVRQFEELRVEMERERPVLVSPLPPMTPRRRIAQELVNMAAHVLRINNKIGVTLTGLRIAKGILSLAVRIVPAEQAQRSES